MKVLLPVLLIVLQATSAYAQKEATNWFFGNKVGLSFAEGCPTPLAGSAMRTWGGSAVMSDKNTGELLFYTNGVNTWNKEHRLLSRSNDQNLLCSYFAGQPALIVPVPGSEHRYYIFSSYFILYPEGYWAKLCDTRFTSLHAFNIRYSIVDMQMDSGMGDIVPSQKNVHLATNSTEKLTAVPHANGRDYWLITHGVYTDAFLVYLISPDGISQPVHQYIGNVHRLDPLWPESGIKGMMKASPNGRRLAVAISNTRSEQPLDLFDFDPATGVLSNYRQIGSLRGQYGVSFSPDNTKLYVSIGEHYEKETSDRIWQFDLLAGDEEAISASGVELILGNPRTNISQDRYFAGFHSEFVDLQLGLDGRLYAASSYQGVDTAAAIAGRALAVIDKPNKKGFASEINYKVFDFEEGAVLLGLPNFMQSYFNGLEPVSCSEAGECPDFFLSVYPNPTTGTVRFSTAGKCGEEQTFSLRIVNSIGQVVSRERPDLNFDDEVDITGYAGGLYLFVLSFPDGRRVVKKVVKVN